MAKKNLLVPMSGTVVIRDGKRVRPPVGRAFQFEGEEVEQLKAGGAKFRLPTNETEEADEGEEATSTAATPSAEKSQAAAKGGKKTATAAKSDKEAEDEDL